MEIIVLLLQNANYHLDIGCYLIISIDTRLLL